MISIFSQGYSYYEKLKEWLLLPAMRACLLLAEEARTRSEKREP
jgi:hypothetical protein